MRRGLELDYDTADKITVLNLKDARETLYKENAMLKRLDKMEDYQISDYGYNHNLINAISTVLRYYGED